MLSIQNQVKLQFPSFQVFCGVWVGHHLFFNVFWIDTGDVVLVGEAASSKISKVRVIRPVHLDDFSKLIQFRVDFEEGDDMDIWKLFDDKNEDNNNNNSNGTAKSRSEMISFNFGQEPCPLSLPPDFEIFDSSSPSGNFESRFILKWNKSGFKTPNYIKTSFSSTFSLTSNSSNTS